MKYFKTEDVLDYRVLNVEVSFIYVTIMTGILQYELHIRKIKCEFLFTAILECYSENC